MITAHSLEQFCASLSERLPDWKRVIRRRLQFSWFEPTHANYSQRLSQFHVDCCLESLTQESTGLHVNLKPVRDGVCTSTHRFFYDLLDRLHVLRTNMVQSGIPSCEYAKVITVNAVPVLIEVKVTTNDFLGEIVQRHVYFDKLQPLRTLFDADVSYVIVAPKDSVSLDKERPFSYKKGIFLVPLYATYDQWHADVKRVVHESGLRYIPQNKDALHP